MTPALFQRTSRRSSRPRKADALALMVLKSARSRGRNSRVPVEDGKVALMDWMACVAF
jgi:hypothetical protein